MRSTILVATLITSVTAAFLAGRYTTPYGTITLSAGSVIERITVRGAVLVVPEGAHPVTVSNSSFMLPSSVYENMRFDVPTQAIATIP